MYAELEQRKHRSGTVLQGRTFSKGTMGKGGSGELLAPALAWSRVGLPGIVI